MLHDIAVGPLLEQPAGKVAPPFAVCGAAHVELYESAGFGHIFPRRRRLAGLETDDGIADAQRVARLHRKIGGNAVAFVEQADHGHALGHRRAGQGGGIAAADLLALDTHRAGLIGGRQFVAAAARQQ